jgi:hypothetical protein
MPKGKGYPMKEKKSNAMGGGASSSGGSGSRQQQTEDGTFFKDSIKTEQMGLDNSKTIKLYHD